MGDSVSSGNDEGVDLGAGLVENDLAGAAKTEGDNKASELAAKEAAAQAAAQAESIRSLVEGLPGMHRLFYAVFSTAERDIMSFKGLVDSGFDKYDKYKISSMYKEFSTATAFFENKPGGSLGILAEEANIVLNNRKMQGKIKEILTIARETKSRLHDIIHDSMVAESRQLAESQHNTCGFSGMGI